MSVPFSAEDFFAVFAAYNTGVWPAQIVLFAMALAIVALALLGPAWRHRAILVALGALWGWMGLAYHWVYFSTINPAARGFAGAFLVEGVILATSGLRAGTLIFAPSRDRRGLAGGALVAYALVLYPLIGLALGHRYPAQPTFGLPCPTTIFTIGVLLWATPRVPRAALVIPGLWALVGTSAFVTFGVFEDAMLPVAALVGWTYALGDAARSRGPEEA